MKWWFSCGSEMHTSKYDYENLAQTWLGLMCNASLWWPAVASGMATSLTGLTVYCSSNDPCKEHDSIQAQTQRPHVLDWSGNDWPCKQQCASIA